MRISRDQMFMAMAHMAALRGTCNRLKVGAIIVVENRPISMGYNGAPPGSPHCEGNCGPGKPCLNTIHAEYNAITWAIRHLGSFPKNSTMYVTHSPCRTCAHLIYGVSIQRLVYNELYRDNKPLSFLSENGVNIEQCPISSAINVLSEK